MDQNQLEDYLRSGEPEERVWTDVELHIDEDVPGFTLDQLDNPPDTKERINDRAIVERLIALAKQGRFEQIVKEVPDEIVV